MIHETNFLAGSLTFLAEKPQIVQYGFPSDPKKWVFSKSLTQIEAFWRGWIFFFLIIHNYAFHKFLHCWNTV